MCHCYSNKLAVGMIELMQFRVIGKLGIASLSVLLDMHLRNTLRVSRVLMQPFQESIAKPVSCVWLRLLAVFTQNLVSVVKNNTAALSKTFKPFDTGNNAVGRNIFMLFIRNKQNICVNDCIRAS